MCKIFRFSNWRASHCFRKANKLTDFIAHKGHLYPLLLYWLQPYCIDYFLIIRNDVLGWLLIENSISSCFFACLIENNCANILGGRKSQRTISPTIRGQIIKKLKALKKMVWQKGTMRYIVNLPYSKKQRTTTLPHLHLQDKYTF